MCRGVAEVIDDHDAFCLFEDFEDVHGVGVICLFCGVKILELFEE